MYLRPSLTLAAGADSPLIPAIPKLNPEFGKGLHFSEEKSPYFSLDFQRDMVPKKVTSDRLMTFRSLLFSSTEEV